MITSCEKGNYPDHFIDILCTGQCQNCHKRPAWANGVTPEQLQEPRKEPMPTNQ